MHTQTPLNAHAPELSFSVWPPLQPVANDTFFLVCASTPSYAGSLSRAMADDTAPLIGGSSVKPGATYISIPPTRSEVDGGGHPNYPPQDQMFFDVSENRAPSLNAAWASTEKCIDQCVSVHCARHCRIVSLTPPFRAWLDGLTMLMEPRAHMELTSIQRAERGVVTCNT